VSTPGALEALHAAGQSADEFLSRHVTGDWGVLDEEDRQANDAALVDGSRLLSAYTLRTSQTIWVITEATDQFGLRYASTIFLPEEY
jgi:hypothetical protein